MQITYTKNGKVVVVDDVENLRVNDALGISFRYDKLWLHLIDGSLYRPSYKVGIGDELIAKSKSHIIIK